LRGAGARRLGSLPVRRRPHVRADRRCAGRPGGRRAPPDRRTADRSDPSVDVIEAVLFDLDDTLYPQKQWLDGVWEAVASAARGYGVDERGMHDALVEKIGRAHV